MRLKWDSREIFFFGKSTASQVKGTLKTRCDEFAHDTLFLSQRISCKRHVNFLNIAATDETFIFALMCLTERYYILHAPFYVKRTTTVQNYADKNFSDGLRSMLIGSVYIEQFLDKILHFNNYELWRENFLVAFFYRTFKEFTAPYFKKSAVRRRVERAC